VISRAYIDAVKQTLTIPEIWRRLNLSGEPRRLCSSPFREDKKPSFSIFDQGRQAKDFATGENFDGPAFLAKALDLPIAEALKRYVAMASGDNSGAECVPRQMDETPCRVARSKPGQRTLEAADNGKNRQNQRPSAWSAWASRAPR